VGGSGRPECAVNVELDSLGNFWNVERRDRLGPLACIYSHFFMSLEPINDLWLTPTSLLITCPADGACQPCVRLVCKHSLLAKT
jgi:hypothetical protein